MAAHHESLTIGQHNCDRSRSVMDELRHLAELKRVDILLLQEPYAFRGKLSGFGCNSRIILANTAEDNPWACIVVLNNDLTMLKVFHLSDAHCVCREILQGSNRFLLVSMYMQYSEPVESFLDSMRRINISSPNHKIVFGADANAKSPQWGAEAVDARSIRVDAQSSIGRYLTIQPMAIV